MKKRDEDLYDKMTCNVILSIGNNLYADSTNYCNLRKCNEDACFFYNTFFEQPALKACKEKSILLFNDNTGEITKDVVLECLHKVVNNLNSDERLIIYFSGHGQIINNEFAWVLYDSNLEKKTNFIMMSEIETIIESCASKEKVIILDACFSGNVLNKSKGTNISRSSLEKIFNVTTGITILASSKYEQISMEKSPSNRSLFTHFLCEYLRTPQLIMPNYTPSIFSMYEYVVVSMVNFCRNCGIEEQIAAIKCESEGIPILGNYRFSEDGSWYKDNYAKIEIKPSKNQAYLWLNNLKAYIYQKLWTEVKNLIIEIMCNSFTHGNATSCEIIVRKQSIEINDNGAIFNQLEKCNIPKGGASITIDFIRSNFDLKDLDMKYLRDKNTNCYVFEFNINQAFNIDNECTIKINSNQFNPLDCVSVPECFCKYYYMEIERNSPISFNKMWVTAARNNIPEGSILVLKAIDNEMIRGIYDNETNIEFE